MKNSNVIVHNLTFNCLSSLLLLLAIVVRLATYVPEGPLYWMLKITNRIISKDDGLFLFILFQ